MHRYPPASCGGGVGNSTLGGSGARDYARSEFSYPSTSTTISSRRSIQLAPYKSRCDREVLNSRLGPPDYYPPAPNCPEETLTKEAVQYGYKEAIEGIEEHKEITLSCVGQAPERPWSKKLIHCYKESIRKRLRAINDARVQKRKAGQVYGAPLLGLLLGKPALFPEQRTSNEDFKRKWIEGLSQPHKRLCSLAEHVPHGYRKKALFEALIKHNVPLLRATWFIKITYLNQVRPMSIGMSTGGPDKAHSKRIELWTKDIIEYMQCLLDEACQIDTNISVPYNRDQSPQTHFTGPGQHHSAEISQSSIAGEEPSLHVKWCYVTRLLQWHYAEGLIHRSSVIDWVLKQLQEKESLEALELLLPVVFEFVDTISLSQQHVRCFVDTIIRWIRQLSASGAVPDFNDHSQEAYNVIFLSELLKYLIIVVPDTFVSLDCFPLPSCVCPLNLKNCISPLTFCRDVKPLATECISGNVEINNTIGKEVTDCDSSIADMVFSIQKRASNLSKAVKPGILHSNQGKVAQNLDKALLSGDVKSAYNCLFEEAFTGESMPDEWLMRMSPCMKSILRYVTALEASEVYAIFFLCEWATCDVRSHREAGPQCRKVTGKKDTSRIYMAVSVLNMKLETLQKKHTLDKETVSSVGDVCLGNYTDDSSAGRETRGNANLIPDISGKFFKDYFNGNTDASSLLQSYGPLHDAIVVWLDLHESCNGGFKLIQLLLMELIRAGIFNLHIYVRQLIISGVLERKECIIDIQKGNWHKHIIRQFPAPSVFLALEDVKLEFDPIISEDIRTYNNERHLVLEGFVGNTVYPPGKEIETLKGKCNSTVESISNTFDDDIHLKSERKRKSEFPNHVKFKKSKCDRGRSQLVTELKQMISVILHFPDSVVGPSLKLANSKSCGLHGKVKRLSYSLGSKPEKGETPHGCDECVRNKKQKVTEDKGVFVKGLSLNFADEEDTWWVKKGPKAPEAVKIEQPSKQTKQNVRGRQKTVRKTQSLAQLAAARIESSQGASSSHICDTKVHCPHHKTASEVESSPRVRDGHKYQGTSELQKIATAMKRLRLVEKWSVACWLQHIVKQLIEGKEKTSIKPSQSSSQTAATGTLSAASDERTAVRWRLTEDEMNIIIYILDISLDLRSVVKFLFWVLPKASTLVSLASHGGRTIPVLSWNRDGDPCDVAEGYVLSCLQRYENILLAANLLPETLSIGMRRVSAVLPAVPAGRTVCPTILYCRGLLKKYGDLASVISWERNFKVSFDQRVVSEIEAYKVGESETNYSFVGLPGGGSEENDEHIRQKLSNSKVSRIAPSLKDNIQRRITEAVSHVLIKERETAVLIQNNVIDKREDGYHNAQNMIRTMIECMRQSVPNDAFGMVSTVVTTIVNNIGQALVNSLPDSPVNSTYQNSSSASCFTYKSARQVIQIHIYCIKMLKEVIGERQSRILEVALAMEASSVISSAISSGKASRSQFQLSPETPELSSSVTCDTQKISSKSYFGKPVKFAAAVTALVIGAIVSGLVSLERIINILKIREGLDVTHLLKCNRPNYNGLTRVGGAVHPSKTDTSIEVSLYWYRVLIGNCKTLFDGLVADVVGEASVLALARMQHMMPLTIIFPPTYSIFSLVVWRHHLSWTNITIREDSQLHNLLSSALDDAVKHEPIRDVCLKDTRSLYLHLIRDPCDSEFAGLLDMHGLDVQSKLKALVPVRGRLFLHAVLDCRIQSTVLSQDEMPWNHGHGDVKGPSSAGASLVNEIAFLLDNLHPAKFHWQWVELRLLLNEQALIDKIENGRLSAFDAMQGLALSGDSLPASEPEKLFTDIVLTRLLVRPDAAPLYSEAVHLLGKSVEEYLISSVRKVLDVNDLLTGRKSLRQVLETMAQKRCLSTKPQRISPAARMPSHSETNVNEIEKRKCEVGSPEEGEVADENFESSKDGKYSVFLSLEMDGFHSSRFFATEKGLADLVLPCLASNSGEPRNTFAVSLVKQISDIEQHIILLTRNSGKPISGASGGSDTSGMKGHNSRKGLRAGSPGLGRRQSAAPEPSCVAALQASLWTRVQFLLPLLPIIHVDRDLSSRNMRHTLAPVLLSLLGTRVVQETMDPFCMHREKHLITRKEHDCYAEMSAASAAAIAGENLFDRILLVLHALLSSTWPSWLKPKATVKVLREVSAIDREFAEKMQGELDRMQLPSAIRLRLQAAMPVLPPSSVSTILCVPPHVSTSSIPVLQPSGVSTMNQNQKNSMRGNNSMGRCKAPLYQEPEEVDPWILLEDGTGSGVGANSSGVSGDHVNLKACSWLKGAVRMRRTDLTYIGAVDDET